MRCETQGTSGDAVADVRGHGLLLALQLESGRRAGSRRLPDGTHRRTGGTTRRPSAEERVRKIIATARAARLQLLPTGDRTGILFTPPFTVTLRQIDRLIEFLDRTIKRL